MIERLIKNNIFINTLYRIIGSAIFRILGIFIKVKQNRILFSSGMGNFVGDSPLVIYNELKKDPFFKDYEMIWAVKDIDRYKADYQVVKIDSLKYFFYALSSKIWITSVNIERGLKFKKKETIYLNTWHGIPLKHIGMDVKSRKDYDFSHIDIFITSGDYENQIYKKAFNLEDEQLFVTGLPRNIELERAFKTQNESRRIKILEQLCLDNLVSKTIILFAPTWKDYRYERLDLSQFCDGLGDSYSILLKSHPLEKWEVQDPRIIDVSDITDINILLEVADILISDYSSIMIDYSILEKPIFAYIPDFDIYRETRGLYVSKNELAPNTIKNENELKERILSLDLCKERAKTKDYRNKFIKKNALNSGKRIAEILKNKLC